MKRALVVVLLALGVAGCGFAGAPAEIVTASPVAGRDTIGCYLMGPTGRLVVDPTYGTAFVQEWPSYVEGPPPGWSPESEPIAWPHGYTARWAGSEIEVHGPSGDLIAVTGRQYEIAPTVEEHPPLPADFRGTFVDGACISPR